MMNQVSLYSICSYIAENYVFVDILVKETIMPLEIASNM